MKPLTQKHRDNLLAGFGVAACMDVAGKNVDQLITHPLLLSARLNYYVYWCMDSLSFLCYIVFIFMMANAIHYMVGFPALKILCMNWIPFGVGDLLDEVSLHASEVNWVEYAALAFTIFLTVLELRNIDLVKSTLMLIKNFFIVVLLTIKKLLLKSRP